MDKISDDEVIFIDGVGAGRNSIKACRDGVQWIMVKDRFYWPLSDSDAKRLLSACCGNGSFDNPATPADESITHFIAAQAAKIEALQAEVDALRKALLASIERRRNPRPSGRGGCQEEDKDLAFLAIQRKLLKACDPNIPPYLRISTMEVDLDEDDHKAI